MKRITFTAQELYILAGIAGRKSMFGIPDGFVWVPEEALLERKQQVSDTLLADGIVQMDFNGRLHVSPDYLELVDIYCSCTKCLTLNRQCSDGASEDLIFWQYGDSTFLAEIDEEAYRIRKADALEIEAELSSDVWNCTGVPAVQETVLPQIALTKAKRLAMDRDPDGMMRVLKQNGADDRTAAVLLDGLSEKAQFLRLVFMDMSSGACEITEKAWLNSRGILFALSSKVVNSRTCIVLTESDRDRTSRDIQELLSAFLKSA